MMRPTLLLAVFASACTPLELPEVPDDGSSSHEVGKDSDAGTSNTDAGSGAPDLCNNRDDAGQCPDSLELDSGHAGMDALAGPPDAETDGNRSDATIAAADTGTEVDASAADPDSYTIQEFCEAKFRVAKLWRDRLEVCCGPNAQDDRSVFLASGLVYDDGSEGLSAESVDRCVKLLAAWIGPNLEFVGSAAAACADKFASQFTEPPADCAASGFPIDAIEATQGKRAQDLTQLSECRAALIGKLALNAACIGDFQCQPGLRCLRAGTGYNCKEPVSNGGACLRTIECADGFVCVGAPSGAERVCRSREDPVAPTAACTLSVECEQGALCLENKCTLATSRLICGN